MGLEERSGPGAENKCLQDQAAYIVVKEKEVTGNGEACEELRGTGC